MKTLAEFIQRLQEDAAFEEQAQSFDHADDLMAFVKRKGYDFTLEQLMREFESGEKPRAKTGGPAPVRASPPPRPDRAEFPGQPKAFSGLEKGAGLLTRSDTDVGRETPVERVPQPQAAMTPPGPEEGPRAGLFKSGGGRHRGFCPQRLKSLSEEES
jgi:predicted ribosomally synthesized peptide with nif11-like leader